VACFVYQSHKLTKHLSEAVDIRRETVVEGTKQSLEKTKKKHTQQLIKMEIIRCIKVYYLLNPQLKKAELTHQGADIAFFP
jgi:membrane-anchored glycerophosphoryl diester phosphodiesterase (GDPDase)